MSTYIRKDGAYDQYQGLSFTKTLTKKSGAIWGANEIAEYVLVDGDGTEVLTGSLTKTGDNLGLVLQLDYANTQTLLGDYLLLVYLKDTIITTFKDDLARYNLTYKEVKA